MWFLRRKRVDSVLLLDIGSGSVGAAYLTLAEGTKPTLHYGVRVRHKEGTDVGTTMKEAIRSLVSHGSAMLRDASGTGRADAALVAVASPWQHTHVEKRAKEAAEPFAVSSGLVRDLVSAEEKLLEGHVHADTAIIATLLNGYEVKEPHGKRVKRLEAVVMNSSIDEALKKSAEDALKGEAHIRNVTFASFPWVSYASLSALYPHERDYLVMDAAALATDITVVAQGRIARVASCGAGVRALAKKSSPAGEEKVEGGIHVRRDTSEAKAAPGGKSAWLTSTVRALKDLSEHQALPRMLFLLADDTYASDVKAMLTDESVRSLWLSDDPLSIITVTPAQLQAAIVPVGEGTDDIFLMLVAYHAARAYTQGKD